MKNYDSGSRKPKKAAILIAAALIAAAAVIGLSADKLGSIGKTELPPVEAETLSATNTEKPAAPKATPKATAGPSPTAAPAAFPEYKPEQPVLNFLFVGVDNDYLPGMKDRGNSDGLVLMTLNRDKNRIVMTSLMRDISIHVPGQYSTKVTMVYHDFGVETLVDTIEQTLGIDIDAYFLVNYLNVVEIVDAIGGIDLELDAAEIYGMNGKLTNINYLLGDPQESDQIDASKAGMLHLNGKQTAALFRIRNTGGNDYGRTARAREILTNMKVKAEAMTMQELGNFAAIVMDNVQSDMYSSDMLLMLTNAEKYLKYDIISNRIPADGTNTGDGSFIYVDYDANIKILNDLIYGDAPITE